MIGALFCSLALFAFPFSKELWMAAGLLWILDAANNTAMEPYRAFIGDKLPESQQTFGFQMQSLFVGAGSWLTMFIPIISAFAMVIMVTMITTTTPLRLLGFIV
jgi:hypothetical protein